MSFLDDTTEMAKPAKKIRSKSESYSDDEASTNDGSSSFYSDEDSSSFSSSESPSASGTSSSSSSSSSSDEEGEKKAKKPKKVVQPKKPVQKPKPKPKQATAPKTKEKPKPKDTNKKQQAKKGSKAAATAAKKDNGKIKKRKNKKKRKNPDAPKNPTSAFFYFAAKRRVELKEEKSKLKMLEMTKLFGTEWRALTKEEKLPFETSAKNDKRRYETAMLTYVAPEMPSISSSDDGDDEKDNSREEKKRKRKEKKEKKAKKDPLLPKKNLNAYMFYVNQNRDKVKKEKPELTNPQVVSLLSTQWKTMSGEGKEIYVRMADEDKKRYTEAMDAYNTKK